MYLSLLTGFAFFPFPDLGVSVHISLTFSRTMLQCLSNAFTLASSFLLFRQLIRTWVLFFTDCVKTDRGPVLNSSCSLWASSSGVISLFGLPILRRKEEVSGGVLTNHLDDNYNFASKISSIDKSGCKKKTLRKLNDNKQNKFKSFLTRMSFFLRDILRFQRRLFRNLGERFEASMSVRTAGAYF